MGFAKYYEDNVSIYVGRMILKSATLRKRDEPPCQPEQSKKLVNSRVHVFRSIKVIDANNIPSPIDRNERRGLELSFSDDPDKSTIRKLQMNGWWKSASSNCWCNTNTQNNRRYASKYVQSNRASLRVLR